MPFGNIFMSFRKEISYLNEVPKCVKNNIFDELLKAAAELGANVVDLVPYSYCSICGGDVWDAT